MTTPGPSPSSSLVLYRSADGGTRVQCRFEDETIWLTQAQLAALFQTTVPNINLHLKAIFAEGEQRPEATIKSYLIVRTEGARQISRGVLHYSLPVILAVGYKAASEHEQFAGRRRQEAEDQGEADAIRALEQAARTLPTRKGGVA